MSRSTMANLIQTVRGLTQAGTAEYTAGTVTYWSDDSIQEVLDRHKYEIRFDSLITFPVTVSGGTVQWRDYQSQYRWFEDTDGGTARFIVQDSTGSTITSYTTQPQRGLINFNSNTGGTAYYLTGFAFDVYGAAADIWQQKGARYATMPDFQTDNHQVKRSHVMRNIDMMVTRYTAMSGVPYQTSDVATVYRGDYAG